MALLEKVHIQGDTNFIGALNKAAKSCNRTQFIVFWANHLISKISRQIALIFENISYYCSFSSQRKFFVMKFFCYVRYKLDTDSNKMRSKYLRNFFWGRGDVYSTLWNFSLHIVYIQNGLKFFNQILRLSWKFLNMWNICACENCHCSLLHSYYSQISWHNMKLRLVLGIAFDKYSWPTISITWSRDFF